MNIRKEIHFRFHQISVWFHSFQTEKGLKKLVTNLLLCCCHFGFCALHATAFQNQIREGIPIVEPEPVDKCEALKRLLALIAQCFQISNFFPEAVVFPCVCYLMLHRGRLTKLQEGKIEVLQIVPKIEHTTPTMIIIMQGMKLLSSSS
ncbi:hypothetical protein ACFX2I_027263 [Malus domestica]